MKRILFILLILAGTLTLGAQQNSSSGHQDCTDIYRSAEAAYQAGLFTDCIKTLESLLDSCDLSRKQKERTLQMLAKAYVETGETGKAESTVNLLLKNYPHYELKEEENPEMFNRMVKRYEIHPKLIIGVKNTGNWLTHKTLKVYSVLDGLDYSRPIPRPSTYWFMYYGCAEYEFIKGLSINVDGSFFSSGYIRIFQEYPSFHLEYSEVDRYIEFPFYIKKYFFPGKNFLLYTSAGFGPMYNDRATGSVELRYTKADVITGMNADLDSSVYLINTLPLKKQLTWQWNAGGGIGYSYKNLRVFVDARYLGGVGSITDPEKSDLLPELKNFWFYIDQEMKINQFEVGLTISYTLVNSVKRMRK